MSNQNHKPLLGILLQNAGLISQEQLQNALDIQVKYSQMKLGEILVLQEGITAKTIEFFVNKWHIFLAQGQQFPIGYYLNQACLLNEQQIKTILEEQKNNQQKFGVLAVKKGWIQQNTINFFLASFSQAPQLMSFMSLEQYNQDTLHLEEKYANYSLILSRILAWTGGNFGLTKTISYVFANSNFNIPTGLEINTVDRFIKESLIKNWQISKAAAYIRVVKGNFLKNSRCDSIWLLKEYRKILLAGNKQYQQTKEQNELLSLGLVVKKNNHLKVANLIYQQIFNHKFISQEISKLETNNTIITNVNPEYKISTITEYESGTSAQKLALSPDSLKIEFNPSNSTNDFKSEQNTNTPEPLTKISSIITLAAIALLIPLFLTINNYYSSLSKQEQQSSSGSLVETGELRQFCDELSVANAGSSLNLISQLEKNKQELPIYFPDNCEAALNQLRVLATPQLGKQSRVLEAIRHLCKIPADSEMYIDAQIWLERWYSSAGWGKETKFYLQELTKQGAVGCPAANFAK
ncbi:MAG TPA: hypothetical protein V6C71_24275 [Coleofasciculaceae cyanobacterium]|jgi:hypothetical protein